MSKPEGLKQQLFIQFARIGKALSNPKRLEMLEFLAQKSFTVENLAQAANLTVATASHHLQQLKQAGLVRAHKAGLYVHYQLEDEDVLRLFNDLRTVGERHLDKVQHLIDTYLSSKDQLEPLPRQELLARIKDGTITVIDVRPPLEFAAAHIPGAINIPLNNLDDFLLHLNPKQEVVAYCRGPHCVLAYDAVEKLRAHGINARRLEDGMPEWRLAGLPVAQDD